MLTTEKQAGRALAERLGLKVIGMESDKIMVSCPFCDSSDAGRVFPEGNYWCHSCQKSLNGFDLCKVTLGDHETAKRLMVEVGLFNLPANGNGHANGDILKTIAERKSCTVAGFQSYGAKVQGRAVVFPMFGPDGQPCSTFTLTTDGGKGLYAKEKPVGLFLPRTPKPGETWAIVEGVKDAAALHGLGFLAAGLPNSAMNQKFAPLFRDVDIVIVPDGDKPGQDGAKKTAANLAGIARSVRIAHLPVDVKASKGDDVRDVLRTQGPEAVRKAIDEALLVGTSGAKLLEYRRLTCAELDQGSYDLEYLIDRTLVTGQPCIVAGGKKCLKTSILLDMGISLAVGGFFLGKLKVNRACKVGIMTGESGLGTIQETARRICNAAGHNLADIGGLVFSEDLPRFGNLEHEDALRRFILADELEVVVIDPAYLCLPGADAGNLFAQGDLLRGMSKVCTDTGCMMILAHHTRKTKVDPFSPPELEDIAWAGFQEFARQWLLVGRREAYQPGTGDHRLWLSVGGSAGHTALWAADISEGTRDTVGGRYWQVGLMHADEARNEVQTRKEKDKAAKSDAVLERDKQNVCNIMAKFPAGESKTVIRDTSGLHSTRFNCALSALLADGVAVSCDIIKGRRKTPIDGYKLKDETPNE